MYKVRLTLIFLMLVAVLSGCGLLDQLTGSVALKDLQVGGQRIANFDAESKTYFVTLPAGTSEVPEVVAIPKNSKAVVEVDSASRLPGITTVRVVGTTNEIRTYLVNFIVEDFNQIPVTEITIPRAQFSIPIGEDWTNLTRGLVCKVIADAFNYEHTNLVNPYSDLTSDHPYYTEILACTEVGLVQGYPDGTFLPDGPVTRLELAILLSRILNYVPPVHKPFIADIAENDWRYPYATFILETGFLSLNSDNSFQPDETAQLKVQGVVIPIVNPVDATIKQVCFTSSNEKVAVINKSGQLTGLSAGTTTITVFSLDGTVQNTCTVQVVSE